jgi:hypothetical protein
MKHYFLYSSLPALEIQAKPDIAYPLLLEAFHLNFNEKEKEQLALIQFFVNLNNIYAYLTGGKWNLKGSISIQDLKECLEKKEGLPDYVLDFFAKYEDPKDQKRFFSKVLIDFFHAEHDKHKGFLKEFICFERDLRLVLLAYRVKRSHLDLLRELQFEDFANPLVIDILARKDAAHYDFPFEFKDLKLAIEKAGPNPLKQHFAIAEYRFRHYAPFLEEDPFSIDSLLAYFVQYMILDDYHGLSVDEGKELLDSILETS